ncbi:MAG: hypothetical protein AB1696_13880 [Planctomycetota bacterium]
MEARDVEQREIERRRARMRELQRMADEVCRLIVFTDYPHIDVVIEGQKVREKCEALFPDRMDLYEMIYESRFERLWEQFRAHEEEENL